MDRAGFLLAVPWAAELLGRISDYEQAAKIYSDVVRPEGRGNKNPPILFVFELAGCWCEARSLLQLPSRSKIGAGLMNVSVNNIPLVITVLLMMVQSSGAEEAKVNAQPEYTVSPIGWVRKAEGRTTIVVDRKYQPALLGVGELSEIWVLYWFDRNDTPERRAILQVHPRRNPENPLRGVFATRAPVRPNLIALSRVRILRVEDNVIVIDDIDAFPDTPVLDLKP